MKKEKRLYNNERKKKERKTALYGAVLGPVQNYNLKY